MKLKNNSKGYTLLEILTVVAILSLIITITVISYNKHLVKNKAKYYESQEELIIQTAKDYFVDNSNLLPQLDGEKKCTTLKTLVDNKYIDEITDYKKRVCSLKTSQACAIRVKQHTYIYSVYLDCYSDYKTPEYKSPSINIEPNSLEKITADDNSTEKIIVEIGYNDYEEKNAEISPLKNYRYIIYKKDKNNKEVYFDSNWKELSGTKSEKKLTIELNKTGTYYAEVWTYNIKGRIAHSKSGEVTLNIN